MGKIYRLIPLIFPSLLWAQPTSVYKDRITNAIVIGSGTSPSGIQSFDDTIANLILLGNGFTTLTSTLTINGVDSVGDSLRLKGNIDLGYSSSSQGSPNECIGDGACTASGANLLNQNTVMGGQAEMSISTGNANSAFGYQSLMNNAFGYSNAAFGYQTLLTETGNGNTGYSQSAFGALALTSDASGYGNTAIGYSSFININGGFDNVALGAFSGNGGVTCSNSIYLGYNAVPAATCSNEIVIGEGLTGNGSNTVTIGNSSITDNYFRGKIDLYGSSSGSSSLKSAATASGALTLPNDTDTLVDLAGTQELSNKRKDRRINTVGSSAAPAINSDTTDLFTITALATAVTSFTTNLTGTPKGGDILEIRIKDNGTAQGLTWGAKFASTTISLPTTTVISTTLRILLEWDDVASVWACVGVA